MVDNNHTNCSIGDAYKFAFLAVFLWSTVATAFKISLNYLTPIELVLYSTYSSALFLFIFLIVTKKTKFIVPFLQENLKKTLLLGLLNPFLYYIILFKAYDLLPAQEAQSINYTWALMLAFLSVPILKHKLTFRDIIAGFVCYFGVFIIASKGDVFGLNFSNLEGVTYALLSTIIWALYWLLNTKSKTDSVVILFSNFLISLPFITIYYFVFEEVRIPEVYGLYGSIYIGLFEMGLAFIFWLKAMQYTDKVSRISNLIFVSPFLSLVFIYFIVGEDILLSTIIGLVFIIFGLFIQIRRRKLS
ncbi:MAG: drug/metabolite transporter (DMT)-like permease [Arcobacteraceae bacterium]|jgi:drug/metabolite transporter (DMT)-like permease